MHGTALLRRACILGTPFRIQTAFIAYPDAMGIVSFTMCPHNLQWAGIRHCTVTTDIIMIANAAKPTTTMYRFQLLYRKTTILSGSGTVNNDMINCSHMKIYDL